MSIFQSGKKSEHFTNVFINLEYGTHMYIDNYLHSRHVELPRRSKVINGIHITEKSMGNKRKKWYRETEREKGGKKICSTVWGSNPSQSCCIKCHLYTESDIPNAQKYVTVTTVSTSDFSSTPKASKHTTEEKKILMGVFRRQQSRPISRSHVIYESTYVRCIQRVQYTNALAHSHAVPTCSTLN